MQDEAAEGWAKVHVVMRRECYDRLIREADEIEMENHRLNDGIEAILRDFANHKGPPLNWKSEAILRLHNLLEGTHGKE